MHRVRQTCVGSSCVEELISLFDKILVPLDGSRSSVRALEVAIAITKKFNGEITLIHAYSVGILTTALTSEVKEPIMTPLVASMPPKEVYRAAKETIRRAGEDLLLKGEEMVKAARIHVEKLLTEGHTVQVILEAAKEGKYDLIVMGAKGMSEIEQARLGSVTERVVRNARSPVLVIK